MSNGEHAFMSFLPFKKPLSRLTFCLLVSAGVYFPARAQDLQPTRNGAVIHSAAGIVRVEVCSDSVIHIVAGPAAGQPEQAIVPAMIQPCSGVKFKVSSDGHSENILTSKVRVEVDKQTGAVRFLKTSGDVVLSEQPQNGRTLSAGNSQASSAQVRQDFLLSPGEALYGLGQHQEGFFDLRDIPVELLQANSNIAIPFLISTNGYGLLWNNPALTQFNPATQAIPIGQDGTGTFQTGPEGEYGFLLSGNYRNTLRLSVNGKQVVDLKNMWLPLSVGAKMHLDANTTYNVSAV